MREILFRGKRVDKKGWEYGGYHRFETRQPCAINDFLRPEDIKHMMIKNSFADWNMPREMEAVEVIADTVGQYTGLNDKDGTMIFEGDILSTTNSNCTFWYVDYKDGSFRANQCNASYDCSFYDFMKYNKVKVIGNIYDDSELI